MHNFTRLSTILWKKIEFSTFYSLGLKSQVNFLSLLRQWVGDLSQAYVTPESILDPYTSL